MSIKSIINGGVSAYIPVPVETICIGTAPAFDLYMKTRDGKYVLFLAGGNGVMQDKLEQFINRGSRILHVKREDASKYHCYVSDNLETVLQDPSTSRERKAEIVYESAANIISDVLENPNSKENIKRANDIAKHTLTVVDNSETVENILAMTAFDYSTHTHCVNVCVYGLSLAKFVGLNDPDTLRDLGAGLLLHDVGKSKVDQTILNKPGKLTAEEFAHMKLHASFGENILLERGSMGEASILVASQHHERFDGGGYPKGMKGKDIHEFARLAAVIDVFDALTTRRAYKDAMPSFEALRIMKNDEGHHDLGILNAFIRMLASGTSL
ncbi:MAG: HD domain-containing protein [Planctomycetes bacterium]|nr:HD domain-containing protein [Planctomycetota bacterium]